MTSTEEARRALEKLEKSHSSHLDPSVGPSFLLLRVRCSHGHESAMGLLGGRSCLRRCDTLGETCT